MKLLRSVLFLLIILFTAISCATSENEFSNIIERDVGGEIVHDSVTIKPLGSYEECIALKEGLVFDYNFDSTDFVNFNIHYHGSDELHNPVDKKGVTSLKGTIDPRQHDYYTPEQEYYCLMWDNPNHEPVKVTFRCTLKRE